MTPAAETRRRILGQHGCEVFAARMSVAYPVVPLWSVLSALEQTEFDLAAAEALIAHLASEAAKWARGTP